MTASIRLRDDKDYSTLRKFMQVILIGIRHHKKKNSRGRHKLANLQV